MSRQGRYVELATMSNFSFLRGASHPEELVEQAALLGLSGLCLTDCNSLAGVVRAHMAAKQHKLAYAPGCRLVFMDTTPDIFVWPENFQAYKNLCELLSLGKRRAPKGQCHLWFDDLLAHGSGLLMAVRISGHSQPSDHANLNALKVRFPGYLYIGLSRNYGADDERQMAHIDALAVQYKLPLLALGDALYHIPQRRPLQDVITCIREHKTLVTAGTLLNAHAERHLRSPEDVTRLFANYEAAVFNTNELFARIDFSLDELAHLYPDDPTFEALDHKPMPSQVALEALTRKGIDDRYPEGAPAKVLNAVDYELALIKKLGYASYFLTVYDIVRYARQENILCQGRGSAANSVVCYCLGITEVDPNKVDLLFERFISEDRDEPPDIDVDFEHEQREKVIQYIYQKYGRDKAGLAASVVTYRSKSALRETARVFGYSDDVITAISNTRWGSTSEKLDEKDARRAGLDFSDKYLRQMLDLASQLIGFPRHLSQHVGGFVITRDRLSSLIPIENAAMQDRTVIEWDKDDLENVGILKIDVLGLGMLSCLRRCFALLETHYGRKETLSSLPDEDEATYDMICRADTIGVFQIESRAQMSMLPRLRPRDYYGLIIEVAIVRPGPIQGDMVHPYLRRRQGLEKVNYPKPELEAILSKTLGVPLFQEQAMRIAIVAANFTPGEADKLRRAMATFRRVGTIQNFRTKMIEGMIANGYERTFAERCFKQIEGFGDYGFPESHAASFALLVYVSCWVKCHYPDVFCAAILNSQPMGFYAPAQLIRDAREHGVAMGAVDVNFSHWDATLEPDAEPGNIAPQHRKMADIMANNHRVRLGFRHIKGFREPEAELLVENRGKGYDSVRDLWMRSGLTRSAVERLAKADCFRSIGLNRRDALWAVKALDPLSCAERLPLFALADQRSLQVEPEVQLPAMPLGEHVIHDYKSLTFSLKAHPMAFLRQDLTSQNYRPFSDLRQLKTGQWVQIAGLVLVRQRPGTASGVIFETLEDETGVANIVVWPKVFEIHRRIILSSRCIGVRGKVQSESGVIHVIARQLEDLTPMLADIASLADLPRKWTRGAKRIGADKKAVQATHQILPKGRNFH